MDGCWTEPDSGGAAYLAGLWVGERSSRRLAADDASVPPGRIVNRRDIGVADAGWGGGTIAAESPWMFAAGVTGLGIGFVLDVYGWVPTFGFPLTRSDECWVNQLGVAAGFVGGTSAWAASFAGFRQMQLWILCCPSAICGGVGGAGEGGGAAGALFALGLCDGDGVELCDLIPGREGEL